MARIAGDAGSEHARISACNPHLGHAYGKSRLSAPIEIELTASDLVPKRHHLSEKSIFSFAPRRPLIFQFRLH